VSLALHVRDATGAVLKTLQVVVPDTFSTGWITWPGIDLDAEAGSTMIFTCYLVGGYDTAQYTASQGADLNQGYTDGVMYVKEATNDADFAAWADWSVHPFWDSAFRLQGRLRLSTGMNDRRAVPPRAFELRQNYPNPFWSAATSRSGGHSSTVISFQLAVHSEVRLMIFNAAGQFVRQLARGNLAGGSYQVVWDGRDDYGRRVASGVYYYRLIAGDVQATKSMLLLQ
jgi:hypothetical protein